MTNHLKLYRVAEQENITIDCFELDSREALSVMNTDGDCFIAINPLKLTSSQDETVKLAHEIGHCVTGSFYNRYATCDVRKRHEIHADKWAINHLIPSEELQNAVEAGYTEVWKLAEYFDVTEDFMRKAICWHKYGNLNVEYYF